MSARPTAASNAAAITELRSEFSEFRTEIAGTMNLILARLTADAPALTEVPETASAPTPPAPTTKPLSRSAWKAARLTKAGTVRKEFAGLTREQAFAKGLLPGYHLPTGAMKAAIKAAACTDPACFPSCAQHTTA